MTREPSSQRIDKSKASVFWRRAVQCQVAMNNALALGHWEAAGINAIHCAYQPTMLFWQPGPGQKQQAGP